MENCQIDAQALQTAGLNGCVFSVLLFPGSQFICSRHTLFGIYVRASFIFLSGIQMDKTRALAVSGQKYHHQLL